MLTSHPSCVRIDGVDVDPCAVDSRPRLGTQPQHRIEVHISAKVLLHELQESDVEVSEETLRDFLVSDARDERGRAAYLTIARAISHSAHTAVLRWSWIDSSDVRLEDGVVTFVGRAVKV